MRSRAEQPNRRATTTDLIGELQRMVAAGHGARHRAGDRRPRPAEDSPKTLERAFRETPRSKPPRRQARPNRRPGCPARATKRPSNNDRQPVHPRQCRYARTPDDHGVRAGAHPQSAAARSSAARGTEFKVPLQRLSNVTAELQEGVMKTRMQPIGNAWQKLPRIVRDLSRDLGKKIELEMHGAETELDRQVLELIKDPLTHMVRNSADHGLETPAERRAAGKPETGRISLKAFHEGGHIIIEIADDGRGLDADADPGQGAGAAGWPPKPSSASDGSADPPLHLPPGFSTAAKVTTVSGRGVGMDVVRTNIEQIGGTIDVKSVPAQGTNLHHQDSADAGDRLRADRRSARRALRHPADHRGGAGARRAAGARASHRADQGHAGAAAARQAAAAGHALKDCWLGAAEAGDAPAASSSSPRSAARPSASWSTACSTPRRSW